MSMTQTEIDDFNASLKDVLPSLRVYALSLTHDRDRAENLVQQTSLKALAGRESFRPGTNFRSWIFRIERNEFISELRREYRTVNDVGAHPALSIHPTQEVGLMTRDLMVAFRKLPRGSRQVLLSKIEGRSHGQIASEAGISIGTVKSRIWRGLASLERLLNGNTLRAPGARHVDAGRARRHELLAIRKGRESMGSDALR